MQVPLSGQAIMSNSIVEFVLAHPEITDVFEAYNKWVQKEQWKDFPWGDPDTPPFCLHMFDFCMHSVSRETLDDIFYEENRLLLAAIQV